MIFIESPSIGKPKEEWIIINLSQVKYFKFTNNQRGIFFSLGNNCWVESSFETVEECIAYYNKIKNLVNTQL